MTPKLTKFQSQTAALIQQIRLARASRHSGCRSSYVMAHVEIESGFDPAIKASDFAKNGVDRPYAGDDQNGGEGSHWAISRSQSDAPADRSLHESMPQECRDCYA
jgi:hypothetical protein